MPNIVLQTFVFTTVRHKNLQNILLAFAHRVCNVLSFVWAHSFCLFEPHRCAQAKAAAAIPAAIVARCPLGVKHCIVPIAQCLLPTTLCPSLTAHYPLPIAWPGGMRGAIEYGQPLAGSAVWKKYAEILSYPTAESRKRAKQA